MSTLKTILQDLLQAPEPGPRQPRREPAAKHRAFYEDHLLARKAGREHANLRRCGRSVPRARFSPETYLQRRELDAIIRHARLKPRQRLLLELMLRGWNTAEAACMLGLSKSGAASSIQRVISKLQVAAEDIPWVGLAEVYASEIRRGAR